MNTVEIVGSAIDSLKRNVLRTALTMLGIIIGISAVILISSIGQGAVAFVSNEFAAFGTNFFQITPGSSVFSSIVGGSGEPLTTRDAEAIENSGITNIEVVAPFAFSTRQVRANNESTSVLVYGLTPEAQTLLKPDLINGEFISKEEKNERVVVVGNDVVEDLFGVNTNPVGETLKIDDVPFRVIGVTKSDAALTGSFFNSAVNIPLSVMNNQLTGKDELAEIDVGVFDTSILDETINDVEIFLRGERDIADNSESDFTMSSFKDNLDTFNNITGLLTLLISGISAISLLVGGIGVMNIMLVSVTERTREIGLLKSIGARHRDILLQFIIESVVMSTIGGLVGVIFGVVGTYLVATVVGIPFIVSVPWIVLSVSISSLVGLVFGYYPARRAAMLSPIDALRYD